MTTSDDSKNAGKAKHGGEFLRRDILKYSAGTFATVSLSSLTFGCGGGSNSPERYLIDSTVVKTTERMIGFPYLKPSVPATPLPPFTMPDPANPAQSPNGGIALTWNQLDHVAEYKSLGYGEWWFAGPLAIAQRNDLMPPSFNMASVAKKTKLLNFFAMTDIHITDKEAPNQLISLQQGDPGYSGNNTSIYSPIMLSTTHVLDAAIQTANVLHKNNP